jgi:hypothetical protein
MVVSVIVTLNCPVRAFPVGWKWTGPRLGFQELSVVTAKPATKETGSEVFLCTLLSLVRPAS